jgi:acetyl-CoA acetyltransferase
LTPSPPAPTPENTRAAEHDNDEVGPLSIYVIGVATHPASTAERGLRLEEMAYRTSRAALDDAGVSRGQLDHLTIGACDELDGRPISSMLMAAPAGGFMTDEMKVSDSGAMALCLGMARMLTGEFQLGLVASWCKTSKTDVDAVMRLRGDPFFSRPLGLNTEMAEGLFAQAVSEEFGVSEEEATHRAAMALQRAVKNPRAVQRTTMNAAQIEASPYVATPLREGQQAPMSDGAATLVLASAQFLKSNPSVKPLARLASVGWCVDSYRLGGARLRSMNSFKSAWDRALHMAKVADANALDVIELETQTSWQEAAAVRALNIRDETKVTPSGGAFAQNPLVCTGLVGVVEAVLQVAGRAGPLQRSGVTRAAAHSTHGFAQQGNVVAIFEAAGAA